MHELSVAESIWNILEDELKKLGSKKLISVKIVIGELSGVVPEALDFYLNLLKDEKGHSETKFVYQFVPVRFQCSSCSHVFTVDKPMFSCPQCGSTDVKIISGNEFYIEEIEVEDITIKQDE